MGESINYLRYMSLVIKVLYFSSFIIVLPKVFGTDALIGIWGTGLFFLISQSILYWFYSLFYDKKKINNLFIVTLLFIIFFYLGMFVREEILYFCIIPIIVEVILVKKMKIEVTSLSLYRYHDLMIILNYIFLGVAVAMVFNYINEIIFIIFAIAIGLCSFFQVYIIFELGKKLVFDRYEKLKKRKIITFFLSMVCFIPILFSFDSTDTGFSLKLDLLIYSGFLMLYPVTMCRLFRIFCNKNSSLKE